MPFAFGASFLGAKLFTIGSLVVTVGKVVGLLSAVAFIAVASALTDQNIPEYQTFESGVNSTIKQANAYRKYIYGRRKTDTLFAARGIWGNNTDIRVGKTVNSDLQIRPLIIGQGPCQGVESIYLLDEEIELDDTNKIINNERYENVRNFIWVNPFLGSKDQDYRSVRPEHTILSARNLKVTPIKLGNIYNICAKWLRNVAPTVTFSNSNVTIESLDKLNPNSNLQLRTLNLDNINDIAPTGNPTGRFWLLTGVFPHNNVPDGVYTGIEPFARTIRSHWNNRRRAWGDPPTLLLAQYDDGFYYPVTLPHIPKPGYLTPYTDRLTTTQAVGLAPNSFPGYNYNLPDPFGYGMRLFSDADEFEDYRKGIGRLQGSTTNTSEYVNDLKEVDTGGLVLNQITGDIFQTAPIWSDMHRLRGVAYLLAYFRFDIENGLNAYPEGFPRVSLVMLGINEIWDPRTNTRGYTDNPVLCMVHYCENEMNISIHEWDKDELIRAANECDAANYRISAAISTGNDHEQNTSVFLNAMDATKIFRDWYTGLYTIYPGVKRTATATLTPSVIRTNNLQRSTSTKRRDRINEVRGDFRSEDNDWQRTEYAIQRDQAAIDSDGQILPLNWDLEGVSDSIQAQKIARQKLRRGLLHHMINCSIPSTIENIKPGLPVKVTFPRYGYNEKLFMIESAEEEPIKHKGVLDRRVVLKEYDPDYIYDFDTADETPSTSTNRQPTGTLQRIAGSEEIVIDQASTEWRIPYEGNIPPQVEYDARDELGNKVTGIVDTREEGIIRIRFGTPRTGYVILN